MPQAKSILFMSLPLFWPRAPLLLVLDAESAADRAINASTLLPPMENGSSGLQIAFSAPVHVHGKST